MPPQDGGALATPILSLSSMNRALCNGFVKASAS